MEAFALYLFKSIVWLTGFALVYLLFLRNERYFLLNRIYLVTGIVASIVFPFFTWHYTVVIPFVPMVEVSDLQMTGIVNEPEPFPTKVVLLILYLAGAMYLLYRIVRQTITVIGVIRNTEILPYRSAKLIRTDRYPSSFSFFSFVFVNPSSSDIETSEIVNHEMEHVRQKHWIDLLLFELLCTLQWLNPMVWLYGRFIRQNHEFLADQHALQRTANPAIYRAALINQLFGGEVISLANSFNYSINKKRFHMMKDTIHPPYRKLKLLVILPMIAAVFYAFATPEYRYAQAEIKTTQQTEKTITGKVMDDKGNPLKGSIVVISGTTIGTMTDDNGSFKLICKDNSPIVISHVGYGTQKLNPDMEKEMIITMKPANMTINEVIVTAQDGNSGQSNLNSNIKIKAFAPLKFGNSDNPDQQPLIVIDGKIADNQKANDILPETIESISVFKGESATALYGDKGKNGVIQITLKPANKALDEVIVTALSSNSGQSNPNSNIKVRGISTWRSGNSDDPFAQLLIIIDGKISDIQNSNNLPPVETIESIEILKDESSTKPYGDKGKNGVMLIKTKKSTSDTKNSLIDVKINPDAGAQIEGKVYDEVQEMPEFPGGMNGLNKFLASTIRYPQAAAEKHIVGKVVVSFIVTSKGNVAGVKMVSGVDPLLDQEALRVVQSMPLWKPGKQDGKEVNVRFTLPVHFRLESPAPVSSAKGNNEPFVFVEQMPEFPGGSEALQSFLVKNIKYPAVAVENGIQGRVFVSFVVTKTGSISNAKVIKSIDASLDKEAKRVVESMPLWIPGKQNGEAVDVIFTIPITFNLPNSKSTEGLKPITAQAGKLVIVPNPTSSKAKVTLEGSDSNNQLQVSVVDAYGKVVIKETKNGPSFTLSVNSLTPGTYSVVAVDGNKQYQGSLVVNH